MESFEKVKIIFFNVNHGDSILLEFIGENRSYMLIDSNKIRKNNNLVCPAYEYLKSKGVKVIDTVVISHFHQDHISGMGDILDEFSISQLVIPPIISKNEKYMKEIYREFKKFITKTAKYDLDQETFGKKRDFVKIFRFIKDNQNTRKVFEGFGQETKFRMVDLEINAKIYLPMKKLKGVMHNIYRDRNHENYFFKGYNDSSIVLEIEVFGKKMLFCGDAEESQINEHKRYMNKYDITNLDTSVIKIPHHGSRNNNTQKVFNYLISRENTEKYGIISADGKTHPDDETIDLMLFNKIVPYCTNLSNKCRSERGIISFNNKNPGNNEVITFIQNYDNSSPIKCQGDIKLQISNSGEIEIEPETSFMCNYHFNSLIKN